MNNPFGQTARLLRRTYKCMAGAPGHSALVVLTLCAALSVVGLYAMTLHNVQGLIATWGRAGNIGCFLKDGTTPQQWATAREQLANLPGAGRADLVTPSAALERFKARGPQAAALVEGVREDVLPALVELYVEGGFTEAKAVTDLAERAATVAYVVSVDVGATQFGALRAMIRLLRLGGWVFGAAVMLAAALICANTIRLVVHAQSDEIEIMLLVGGTPGFVRLPYVLQGVMWGALAAFLVDSTLWLLHRHVAPMLSHAAAAFTGDMPVSIFHAPVAWGLLLCGMLLGALGSTLAVQRYLHAELP